MDFLESEQPKQNNDHSLWVEKFRPTTLDGYVGNEMVKETIKIYLEKQDIPHLLFHGPPGTGKTTSAKVLARNIKCDVMYINASAERGIDTIREKIKNFSCGVGFRPLKILILDEADQLTPDAQGALRNTMETNSAHTRFILTCNHPERIVPAIQSRCQVFEIKPISKKEVAVKLATILKEEGVEHTIEDIAFIVNKYYPDIRKVINFAQQSELHGKLKICKENALESDFLAKIVFLLSSPTSTTFNEIRQLVADADPNNFDEVYRYLLNNLEKFSKGKDAQIILDLAESVYQSTLVLPQARDITFVACVYKILTTLRK